MRHNKNIKLKYDIGNHNQDVYEVVGKSFKSTQCMNLALLNPTLNLLLGRPSDALTRN